MNEMSYNNLSRRDISSYVITTLDLKPKGRLNLNAAEIAFHCPFHVDKTPSFFINMNMGVYNCFSCGKSGSVESLYYELTGTSLKKALGINTDPFTGYAAREAVSKNYRSTQYLQDTRKNLDNITVTLAGESIKSAWYVRSTRQYLISRGISEQVASDLKFGYAKEIFINGTRFYRRLLIPVYENNRLVAVEGRRVFKEDPDPKVLYAKNCSVNTLFDIDNLNKEEDIYAVEGLMDLAVLRSSKFFKNSTSIFGANITQRQLDLISDFKKFIYIPDSDEAGNKTVQKLKDSGLQNIYILPIPKTINDVAIKDIGDLPKANISSQDLIDRKWLSYMKKLN